MQTNVIKILALVVLAAVAAWFWIWRETPPATPPNPAPIAEQADMSQRLAVIYEADQIEEPVERCLRYPIPEILPAEHSFYEFYCREAGVYKDQETIKGLLNAGEFARIDELVDGIQADYLAGNTWEQRVYSALEFLNDGSEWSDQVTLAWLEAQPQSHAAHVARSWVLRAQAYQIQEGWSLSRLTDSERETLQALWAGEQAMAERALELNPRFLPAISRKLGLGGWRDGTGPEDLYTQGIAIDENSFVLRWMLLNVLPSDNQQEWERKQFWQDKIYEELADDPRLAAFEVDDYISQGRMAWREEDYESVEQIAREGLSASPTNDMLRFSASVYNGLDDPITEFELLSKASSYYLQSPANEMDRAKILNDLGEYQWAADILEKARERFPGYYWSFSHLATSYFNLGRYEDAIEAYRERLKYDHNDASSNRAIAWIYINRLNQPEKALPYIDEQLALEPGNSRGWALRMDAIRAEGGEPYYEAVEQYLRYVDRSNPENQEGIRNAEADLSLRDQQTRQMQAGSEDTGND